MCRLDRQQLAEVSVQPVVRVLPHRAGVEDDHVRDLITVGTLVSRLLEQACQALGVVEVHLAPKGANLVGARRVHINIRGYAPAASAGAVTRARPHAVLPPEPFPAPVLSHEPDRMLPEPFPAPAPVPSHEPTRAL